MKYEVGDRVKIKSLGWYNENKDEDGNIDINHDFTFYADRSKYCGKVFTISEVFDNCYGVKEDNNEYYWTDEMIEGLVEEETKPKFKVGDKVITNKGYIGKFKGWVSDYQVRVLFEESGCNVVIHPKDLKLMEEETKSSTIEEAKTYWDSIKDAWICPDGYQFKDEHGNVINATKIVLEKKKKEYPKTYEECYQITGLSKTSDIYGYKNGLLFEFQKLLIARDTYWKLYGEEMGLGKSWEPYWEGEGWYVIVNHRGDIVTDVQWHANAILAFPTAEMRDAFYENFKELIEICKELL